MKFSWSSMQKFIGCPRSFEWSKVYRLRRKGIDDGDARMLGSLVHAGFEKALDFSFHQTGDYQVSEMVAAGRYGVIAYYNENLKKDMPEDYYAYMAMARELALDIVAYQIPQLGIGEKYRVASYHDVFGANGSKNSLGVWDKDMAQIPMLEWDFSYDWGDHTITGIIDAVLQDLDSGELILVDFKCRRNLIDDGDVIMDGQLPFYATLLSQQSIVPIRSTIQWQVAARVPKPAKINKDGTPSVAAIASTPAAWAASLRALGIDPEKWLPQMEGKLHSDADFSSKVYRPVTETVRREMLHNLDNTITMIELASQTDSYPAAFNAYTCAFCDFKKLCLGRLGGASVEQIIHLDFDVDSE